MGTLSLSVSATGYSQIDQCGSMSAQWMRTRLSSESDCWRCEPPPALSDLHLVAAGAPAPVNKRFTDRLHFEHLRATASSALVFCRNTFVIQCDNGSESVRAFSSVPVDSGSWHTNRDQIVLIPSDNRRCARQHS